MYAPNLLRDPIVSGIGEHKEFEPFIAITGGQKHGVLGLDRVAQVCGVPILYSDLRPPRVRVLRPGDERFSKERLANPLTMEEYFHSRGRELMSSSRHRKIWPGPSPFTEADEFNFLQIPRSE